MYSIWRNDQKFKILRVKVSVEQSVCVIFLQHPLSRVSERLPFTFCSNEIGAKSKRQVKCNEIHNLNRPYSLPFLSILRSF